MDTEIISDANLVCIINSAYQVVSFNDALGKLYPDLQVGSICYKEFMQTERPCTHCPLMCDGKGQMTICDSRHKQWLEVKCGEIQWPGEGKCIVLVANTVKDDHLSAEVQAKDGGITRDPVKRSGRPSKLVYHELTGLPCGNKFREEVQQYVRVQKNKCCMLVIDIEYFRFFNKWYGRESGDRMLKRVGNYFREFDRTYHSYSGYCGGDNFCTVFVYSEEIAEKLRADLCSIIGEFEGISGFRPIIGGYIVTDPECSYRDMYDYATTAMRNNASRYQNKILWYGEDMVLELENELRLLPDIERGLREKEFTFYLQMKYSLSSQRVVGAEALLRWNHKTRGLVMPGQFIPQCEKSGMITRLDQYLWEEVCRTLRGWLDQGYDPVPVSVNVSRRDFYEIDVPGYFSDLVKKYGIESRYLEIEITESAFVEDAEVLQEAERKFHELGFAVLIDDFGSGYSSLNMLKDIQADVLKLDMKFLDLNSQNLYKGKEIVRSIFDMANTLNYKVIAEGVETKEQLNTLQSIGCDYVQGYYFYHPLPVKEYERLLPKGA